MLWRLRAGAYHNLALAANGTVVAWGAGVTNAGVTPNWGQAMIPAGLSNVAAVACGGYHSLALQANGTVVAWGAGTNNTGTSPSYGQAIVPVGLSNVVAIAAGTYHSLALKADGTVVVWGAGTSKAGPAQLWAGGGAGRLDQCDRPGGRRFPQLWRSRGTGGRC